jgi:hypothetical protein
MSIAHWLTPVALTSALLMGGCKKADNTLAQDSTAYARDLQLANHDSTAQPQLSDVPPAAPAPEPAPAPAPAPVRSTPRVRTSQPRASSSAAPSAATTTRSGNTVTRGSTGSERAVGTVASGTALSLTSTSRVCTNTNQVGDKFTATVNDAVAGSNGATIPAGAKAVIAISDLKKSGSTGDAIQMTFNVTNLSWGDRSYPVDATIDHVDVEKVRSASKKSDAIKVGGGAVVGGILGRIIGHNTKGTIIGAATGAAAGTAVAMGTADYDDCVPVGGNIKIHLNSPAQIQGD